jgi:hypothetical protein
LDRHAARRIAGEADPKPDSPYNAHVERIKARQLEYAEEEDAKADD